MTAYLDYAGIGLLRASAREAMHAALDDVLAQGAAAYGPLFSARAQARAEFARLLSCDSTEVALVPNTSTGVHLVADGLDWHVGDEVVVFDQDFPANVHPWRRLTGRGVVLRYVPMRDGGYDLADVAAVVGRRTRVIAVSQVNFVTGFEIDLDAVCELAKRVGALVSVDAVQSLGVIPVAVTRTPIDFISAGAHKWLCAPPGTGVFYCRRELLDLLRWGPAGWFGFEGAADMLTEGEGHLRYDLPLRPGANRFEGGMPNMLGFVGLAEALGELNTIGIEAVSERVQRLTARLRHGLRELGCTVLGPAGSGSRSGIVTFVPPAGSSRQLYELLIAGGWQLSYPDGKLRVSPHYWTRDEEISEFLLDITERLAGRH
jgi:cysteine desulfurase/selenocysteine lyase